MTDDTSDQVKLDSQLNLNNAEEFGTGWIPSPPDERDFPMEMAYTVMGVDMPLTVPAAFEVAAPEPPTLNQHNTPQCVAYSHAWSKGYQDLRDTGPAVFDENTFFTRIGGTSNGAIIRNALDQMLKVGYPVVGTDNAALHRITAYFAVPVTRTDMCAALVSFGPLTAGVNWPTSWMFNPGVKMTLPAPSGTIGGHAIVIIGYDSIGLICMNSWGSTFGSGGKFIIPWAYTGQIRESWKSLDVIDIVPPKPKVYRLSIKHGATVQTAVFNAAGRIKSWDKFPWTSPDSGAPCAAPVEKKTVSGVSVITAKATGGKFTGKFVKITPPGVSLTSK